MSRTATLPAEDAVLEMCRALYMCARRSDDGKRVIAIMPLLYTYALIVIDDELGLADRWCYQFISTARAALATWSGNEGTEPDGWIRHPFTGRRRPHGDAAQEHVMP